jgi:anti-sigma factor RsiW
MDGELPGVEHRQVYEHLHRCEECEREYATLLQMKRMLGSLRVQEPRPELPEMILRRVNLAEQDAAYRRFGRHGAVLRLLQSHSATLRPLALGTGMACVAVLLTAQLAKPEEEIDFSKGMAMQVSVTPLSRQPVFTPISISPQTYPLPHKEDAPVPLQNWQNSYPSQPNSPVRLQLTPVGYRSF